MLTANLPSNYFSNPIGLSAARRQVTSGVNAVRRYGMDIWESMCFHYEHIKHDDLVKELLLQYPLMKPRTADNYVRAFIAYCLAAPTEFEGPASRLTRLGAKTYKLVDPS